jgi:drug/metabolite transporter (DMT)-like permease
MDDDRRGIVFVLFGMSLFSIQDILIRELSDLASLTQIMSLRGLVGGLILICFLKYTKRPISLHSSYPILASIRVVLFFTGFLCFYFALGEMGLAEATSLFFVSPIFVTIFSKFIFKNEIGIYRWCAVIAGFVGVLMIVKPNPEHFNKIALLPLASALTYSISMMIAKYTRDKDSMFQQMMHMYWSSAAFGMLAGIGLPVLELHLGDSKSLMFLLRDWSFSDQKVLLMMLAVCLVGSAGMLLLTTAYRIASPPVIAPFEYVLLVLAVVNGLWFFGEVPDLYSFVGMFLITGSGMFIFVREGIKREPLAVKTSLRT